MIKIQSVWFKDQDDVHFKTGATFQPLELKQGQTTLLNIDFDVLKDLVIFVKVLDSNGKPLLDFDGNELFNEIAYPPKQTGKVSAQIHIDLITGNVGVITKVPHPHVNIIGVDFDAVRNNVKLRA